MANLFADISEAFHQRGDLLAAICGEKSAGLLNEKRTNAWNQINRDVWGNALAALRALGSPEGSGFAVKDGAVVCGEGAQLDSNKRSALTQLITDVLPWRKGPWRIAGEYVDTEWRSDRKFDSMEPLYSEFKGKTIADIGSGNGYYAARLSALGASAVLCLDPSERFLLQFELFQKFAKQDHLQLELLGFEDAPQLGHAFDVALCMGVLYHQRNPLAVIEACKNCLRPGGALVLESMTYPGNESTLFFPPERYAKARNVYFLPTAAAMLSLCKRSGFKSVEMINERRIDIDEQRRTALAPYESLSDFLDPNDSSKTVEGWPAPQRAIIYAKL